ncbi:MAG: hypothetical protein RRC34_05775 [Lentisphaeria bacterium]|nr:hypothetical protein [Lentisphaeria bacterium]
MRKIREIIRLSRLGGLYNRQIASNCSLSPTSVGKVVTAPRESGPLGMDLPEMTEAAKKQPKKITCPFISCEIRDMLIIELST